MRERTFGKRQGGGRRSSARDSAPLTAVYTALSKSDQAIVLDLSGTGARIQGGNLPEVGREVLLSIEGVTAFGTVAWAEENECGITFEPQLSLQELKSLKRNVAVSAGIRPEIKAAFDDWRIGLAR